MKTLIYDQHGGPDVLQYREEPDPQPGPRDVVLDVTATTINHLDVLQRNGWFTMEGFTLPHISGMDVVGTIVDMGEQVSQVKVGDRVVVDPSLANVPEDSKLAGMGDIYGALGILGANCCGWLCREVPGPGDTSLSCPRYYVLASCRCFPHSLDDSAPCPV